MRLLPAVLLLATMDSVITYVLTRKLNTQSHDRALIDTTRALARQVVMTSLGPQLDPSWNTTRFLTTDPDERTYFRISVDGEIIAGTAVLPSPPMAGDQESAEDDAVEPPRCSIASTRPSRRSTIRSWKACRCARWP